MNTSSDSPNNSEVEEAKRKILDHMYYPAGYPVPERELLEVTGLDVELFRAAVAQLKDEYPYPPEDFDGRWQAFWEDPEGYFRLEDLTP